MKNSKNHSSIFNFNYKERIFIICFSTIIFLSYTLPKLSYLYDSQLTIDSTVMYDFNEKIIEYLANKDSLIEISASTTNPSSNKNEEHSIQAKEPSKPSFFNPKTVTIDKLLKNGVSPFVANNFIKFRERGFNYNKQSDFSKIYGISEADLKILNTFAKFPPKTKVYANEKTDKPIPSYDKPKVEDKNPVFRKSNVKTKSAYVRKEDITAISIDVNNATIDQWQELRGIGPGYAKLICNFRNKLGGFISIAQVGETYYLPDSVFKAILPSLTITHNIRKIPLLSCTKEELAAHPFISFKQAKIVSQYVEQRRDNFKMNDLYDIYAFDSVYINKIKPYLSL